MSCMSMMSSIACHDTGVELSLGLNDGVGTRQFRIMLTFEGVA